MMIYQINAIIKFSCVLFQVYLYIDHLASVRTLYQHNGDRAKQKFCSQKRFDSLTFDGDKYKFTVNRQMIQPGSSSKRYIFEEFSLKYDYSSQKFSYKSSTFDDDNLVQIGGFYIRQLNTYVEFYKNLSLDAPEDKKVAFCPYYEVPHFTRRNCTRFCSFDDLKAWTTQTLLELCDWRYVDIPCVNESNQQVYPRIFSRDLFRPPKTRKKDYQIAFVYDYEREKPVYIFSSKTNSFVVSTQQLFNQSSSEAINWHKETIGQYNHYRFVGAFNWPEEDGADRIYLLAEPNWIAKQSTLLELELDSHKFKVTETKLSWRKFFACESKHSHFERRILEETSPTFNKKRRKPFNILACFVLSLVAVIVALCVFAFLWKARFSLQLWFGKIASFLRQIVTTHS